MGRPSRCTPSVMASRMNVDDDRRSSSFGTHADVGVDSNSNDHAEDDGAVDCSISSISSSNDGSHLPDFIVPALMEYLGVRSLVRFGETCKRHAGSLSNEIERRRAFVADAEVVVARLMKDVDSAENDDGDFVDLPTRANVIAAKTMARRALRYIDDELDLDLIFRGRHHRHSLAWKDYAADVGERDVFFHERGKFLRLPNAGLLYILPDVFYFPHIGEDDRSSAAQVIYHGMLAAKSWVVVQDCDEEHNPYNRSIEGIANWLAWGKWSSIGAYRIAARALLKSLPYTCAREQALDGKALHYFSSILHKADDIDAMNARLKDKIICE
jgi:hypothetical protein